ncbi:GH36-type glycosyl hydrolase domain-containing protein [Parabacteroides sp. Marseille-P3160]|uniref:GH36-type glycosyl hydrolase domain-containing protein n=1 Tax=Parabacteroides sp. Marseille-P3160 TaxID=1917887 RepID=UPI0009BA81E9|nr:glucoamylase family protein [Parabacteroides sp. Marseille-P3160]
MDKIKYLESTTLDEKPLRDELFNIEQLIQHARGLACRQQLANRKKDHFLLARLNYNDKVLHEFNKTELILKKPYNVTPATTWLIDNFYLIEEQIQLARLHFPQRYSQELPCLATGLHRNLPRIYSVILELISHVDAQIDEASLQAFIGAYQTESPLKLGELWAVPIMLRLALIENLQRIVIRLQENQLHRDKANLWINKLQLMATKRPSRLIEVVSDMSKSDIPLTSAFVSEFCQRMSLNNPALHIARNWLEQRLSENGLSIEELLHAENQNLAADQLSVSHSINSFRTLSAIDWKDFVESLSFVDKILRNDPARIYPMMDFATRDHYRHSIERFAKKSSYSEMEVARETIKLAEKAERQECHTRNAHVGFYLIDDGQIELMRVLKIKKTLGSITEHIIYKYPLFFYAGGILLLSLIGSGVFIKILYSQDIYLDIWKMIILSLIFLLCVSQLVVDLVNWLSMLLISPKVLPRLDFSEGIPTENTTMVVIPTMLSSIDSIEKLIDNLELHYLSNRDANLHFALLTDFLDAEQEIMPFDESLLERAKTGIETLNRQYTISGNGSIFYLFHRPRLWNKWENKWMGYERKRGKLMDFNEFLRDSSTNAFSEIVGDTAILSSIKYVITLDTDTQLPGDSAYKLVGTMAHPLNHPVFDTKKNIVIKGYGILQPRVSINLESSQKSIFTRLASGDIGIDPYTRAISDVYQDIFREGSYVGKGIYDVDAFEQALAGRFPENKILSHDLLESAYVRSALISDVEMYESYPPGYNLDAIRRHRWIRGDWQIIQWLFPRVPTLNRKWERNPISRLGKWKLLDNLRRSLIPPGLLLLLVSFYYLSPKAIWLVPLLIPIIVTLPLAMSLLTNIIYKSKEQSWYFHLREVSQKGARQFKQILLSLILLPYEAYLNSTAILTSLWRLLVTHRHLLKWKTSIASEQATGNYLSSFYTLMWFTPALAVVCIVLLSIFNPLLLLYSFPIWIVWLIAPYIAWLISRPIKKQSPDFTAKQTLLLHRIARKTWYFFETFVTARENWLPPDNFQEIPEPVIASRTSPTNIGLALLANLSAYDFGYLSAGKMLERTQLTFMTMNRLEKYRNHFYNWYDTHTLQPLFPLYISSVDSGNLAGHLLTLGQGIRELEDSPIYTSGIFSGLLDTVRVIKEYAVQNTLLLQLETDLEAKPQTLQTAFAFLQSISSQIDKIIRSFDSGDEELQKWGRTLKDNCDDHINELLYIAPWIQGQYTLPEEGITKNLDFLISKIKTLDYPLTLKEVSELGQTICPLIELTLTELTEYHSPSIKSLTAWLFCIHKAADHATERIGLINLLARQSESFSQMDFTFLYNTSKKLFTIGYNLAEQRSDTASYDMLASEARLCSYVAIAQGQIPQEHWFSLSRLLFITEDKPVLLSWSGSMFEYLMPLLVMPNFEQTLLDKTYEGVVQVQIEYGKTLGVPWGISESGYNRTDTHLNYQYKAFGIPSLGLKRGLSKDLVITPYATVMALMVAPIKACENMERLTATGHEGLYGYYEAIDYTPSHLPPNESSVNIHSFMVHHQGMSLLALTNLAKDNVMQRRFMSCPILKANELLLQERVPRSISANIISDDSEYEIKGTHPLLSDTSDTIRHFKNMDIAPEINLLSNGHYHIMVNNAGGGYSRWNNIAVTRWREDATSDNLGLFVYLKERNSSEFHSITYQPVHSTLLDREAIFTQAYSEFHQKGSKLETHMTICISPEDDIELRRIRLINHSHTARTIELTTYSEVVIAPQAADEAHPAFSNLFVQTEFVPDLSALLCTRRARSENEYPPCLIHLLLVDDHQQKDISCETDRALFIGRGCSLNNPLAMQHSGPLSNSCGSVLDPAISLRRTVTVPPDSEITVCVLLGMTETREAALALVDKYQNIRMTERAFELAWTHNQVVLHQLNITEAEAQLYSKLAGSLVYANSLRRASQTTLKSNRRGQDGLWSYSISGDVPIVLVRISDLSGIELVRQIVLAHAYWRMKGLTVELIIVNEDVSVYRQSVHDEIVNLISSGIEAPLLEKAGGIFVRRIEQVPHDDMLLLLAAARIVLSDEQGTFSMQLESLTIDELQVPVLQPVILPISTIEKQPSKHKLIFENGLGGFTSDGHEYVITLQPGQTTPAPWCNVLANEQFGTVVSESGGAYTWAENAHEFRLTPWNNDPVKDASGEAFYIRDERSGQFWSPTPLPAKGRTPYVIRHGFGYTVFEHSENGIESELTVYVAIDAPVKLNVLKLRNVSGRSRKISVTGYYEWVLADLRPKSLLHIQTEIDVKTGVFFARNFYNIGFAGQIAFLDVGEPRTLTGDRTEFIGRNGSLSQPAAMKRTRLSGKVGAGLDPCGAVQVVLELANGQEREIRFRLGFAHNKDEMRDLVSRFRQTGAAKEALGKVGAYWNKTLGVINVDTPDPSVNVMANGWLLYQTISSRIWARSGYYQSGGAYGFRDQLQDVMALVHAEPMMIRKQILRAAGRQFKEGDVQHWWHPPSGRGVRTHFSDDYLWLPYVVSRYVTSVGDTDLLDENVPFIEGRLLGTNEESYYDLPGRSGEWATVYEHCVRSIKYGLKFGDHGLPLMGCGDWNDGMNLVGKEGRGESVWLGFFLYDVLLKFSELAVSRNNGSFARYCIDQAEILRDNIRKNAWDGEWYRRAYFDNGMPLGSRTNEECRIDSLPQSWSVISGAGDPERSAAGMAQVDIQLVHYKDKLIQLFTPAFDQSNLNPGYIKGYIPGVRENGGQYTHGAIWAVLAFALMGETEKAWELFDLLNPVQHGNSAEQIAVYKVEPYVIAADIYAAEGYPGRGGWTWYTGSAAWMYRLLVETLLGINLVGDRLDLSPHLPKKWDRYKVHYRYKETVYHITFSRISDSSSAHITLDGKILDRKNSLPLINDKIEHSVEMWIE